MDDIEDGLGGVIDVVTTLLSRGVGTNVCTQGKPSSRKNLCGRRREGLTDVVVADGDLLAVGLVDGAVDLLQVVGVGDELVTGDDVLRGRSAGACPRVSRLSCLVIRGRSSRSSRHGATVGVPRFRRLQNPDRSKDRTHLENNHFGGGGGRAG